MDIVDRIDAERTARACDPMRPANPLLREAAECIGLQTAALNAAIHVINILRSPHAYYEGAEADAEKTFDAACTALRLYGLGHSPS